MVAGPPLLDAVRRGHATAMCGPPRSSAPRRRGGLLLRAGRRAARDRGPVHRRGHLTRPRHRLHAAALPAARLPGRRGDGPRQRRRRASGDAAPRRDSTVRRTSLPTVAASSSTRPGHPVVDPDGTPDRARLRAAGPSRELLGDARVVETPRSSTPAAAPPAAQPGRLRPVRLPDGLAELDVDPSGLGSAPETVLLDHRGTGICGPGGADYLALTPNRLFVHGWVCDGVNGPCETSYSSRDDVARRGHRVPTSPGSAGPATAGAAPASARGRRGHLHPCPWRPSRGRAASSQPAGPGPSARSAWG